MTDLDKRIDRHASLMQVNFAIGNHALAMRHCRIFTTLARRRAAPLFNDGTSCAAWNGESCPSIHAVTQYPDGAERTGNE